MAQEAWVQQGTIRNNILFGKPYDSLKYKAVLEACCLLKDFEILPQRDETLVEERVMTDFLVNIYMGLKCRCFLLDAVLLGYESEWGTAPAGQPSASTIQ